jgi:chorismate mutase
MENAEQELADWRAKIDGIDEQIVKLINERAAAATAIGEVKYRNGMAVYEPGREKTVIDHVCKVNPGPLTNDDLAHIYERLVDVMRSLQKKD